GYGLDELVRRSLEHGTVAHVAAGDENEAAVGHAVDEATGRQGRPKRPKDDGHGEEVVVLASGNLRLVYLMEEEPRLTLEEIRDRHPRLPDALRSHPHIGWLLVRSERESALVLGPRGTHRLADGRIDGEDPLAGFSPNAPAHLLRTDGFAHAPDILV